MAAIKRNCPMCDAISELTLTDEQAERAEKHFMGQGHIQVLLPELNAFEREFLITGYCVECQSRIFGITAPKNTALKKVSVMKY